MPRHPWTVRIPSPARIALDDVVRRTHRPRSQFIQDAIVDLSRAYVCDDTVIDRYAEQIRAEPMSRFSILYSGATEQILSALHQGTGRTVSELARIAWVRWVDERGADDIVNTYGAIRPGAGERTA